MEKKRIVLISHNDILGGAAIVTFRLMKALREMGHDVKMLVFNKQSNDPDVVLIANHAFRTMNFLRERFDIYMKNGRSRGNLFKVSTGATGLPLRFNKYIRRADAILLNWVNQATVSLSQIEHFARSGKKIIWTMHDMWCMTGICHHSFGCTRYHEQCGNCPFLGIHGTPDDMSHRVWKRKYAIYDHTDIRFVAVSSWVRDRAAESSLLHGRHIPVIHNAFPSELFGYEPLEKSDILRLRNFKRVIVFGAANLHDSVKGIEYAIDALNIFKEKYPELTAGAVAVFFGQVHDNSLFDRLKFPHIACGTVTDHTVLQHIYSMANVVLSTSRYETLGGTLIEGMSCGATPVSFGEGGQTDFIHHKVNGYIAQYLDPADIADGIRWALEAKIPRRDLHDYIAKHFDARKIAAEYLRLISE